MRKLRIYLDTSVINFLFVQDAPDFRRATEEFFDRCEGLFDLYVSEVVLLEILGDPDAEHQQQLLAAVQQHNVNVLTNELAPEARRLAEVYMQAGIVPRTRAADALHIAFATVHDMDALLSWNFRHLANVGKESRILATNAAEGYRHPLRLTSPLEVTYEQE